MNVKRRTVLGGGGALLAAGLILPFGAQADTGRVEIGMVGNTDGSRVWFDPIGLHIQPGQVLRWTNRDAGNSHTATAYHPRVNSRPLRMPSGAEPWDSDYLLPGETFSLTLTVPGVYDYYCVPHEHAGMVGRIVVGQPADFEFPLPEADLEALPETALAAFPEVAEVLAKGIVRGK